MLSIVWSLLPDNDWWALRIYTLYSYANKPNKSPLRNKLLALLLWKMGYLSSSSRSGLERLILTLWLGRGGGPVGGVPPHKLGWCFCFQVSHITAVKMLARAEISSEGSVQGLSTFKLIPCWQASRMWEGVVSVPCWLLPGRLPLCRVVGGGFSIGQPIAWQLTSIRVHQQENKWRRVRWKPQFLWNSIFVVLLTNFVIFYLWEENH